MILSTCFQPRFINDFVHLFSAKVYHDRMLFIEVKKIFSILDALPPFEITTAFKQVLNQFSDDLFYSVCARHLFAGTQIYL